MLLISYICINLPQMQNLIDEIATVFVNLSYEYFYLV